MSVLASIPSPSDNVWHLGPLPLRAYALCILAGIVVAIWLGERRWVARGGRSGTVTDVAVWAVPFGIIGGRIYHVATDWQKYFGDDGDPVRALQIWRGGLGIWGAIAFGGLGAWIACRRKGIALPPMADALAPGIALAQAIGRWGNWFNQELFGRPSDLPWAVKIDVEHRPNGYEQFETFQPTFLYESIWCIGVAIVVIWADRRFRMGHGRAFALYVALYTLGRGWIEALRIDDVNEVLGLRLNIWTSILVFLGAVAYIVISARRHPGREEQVEPDRDDKEPAATSASDAAGEPDESAGDSEEAAVQKSGDAANEPEDAAGESAKQPPA